LEKFNPEVMSDLIHLYMENSKVFFSVLCELSALWSIFHNITKSFNIGDVFRSIQEM
jgi:hypothetical protein